MHRRGLQSSASIVAFAMLLGGESRAAPAPKPLPEGITVGFAPRDAAMAAWLDLSQNVAPEDHRWQWYVWNDAHEELPTTAGEAEKKKAAEASRKSAAVLNLTINEVLSRNGRIMHPGEIHGIRTEVAGPTFAAEGRLLRYDLRKIAPRPADRNKLWFALQEIGEFETSFHEPAAEPQTKWIKKQIPWYQAKSPETGEMTWYDYKWEKTVEHRGRQFALHAGGAGPLRLLSEQAGGNLLPITRGSEFLPISYGAIKIDGVIGRYHELAGIDVNPKGMTGFDAFLESVGVNQKFSDRFAQRAAMISNLAYRWRRVDAFYGQGVRPEFGASLITVTRDIKNNETNAKRNAYLNLLYFQDQAREVIAAKPNGLHLFLLTDGEGKILNEATGDVVPWKDSPHGGSAQLFSAISCKACHGASGGYKPFVNEVRLDMRKGFVPAADATSGKSAEEVREEVEAFYDGDLDGPIAAASNAYASAVDRATWGLFGKEAVQDSTSELMRMYGGHIGPVTPRIALREMGFLAKDDATAAKAIREMCPPSVDEHGLIGRLRLGGTITRGDWREISYEVALRTMLYREPIPETKKALAP